MILPAPTGFFGFGCWSCDAIQAPAAVDDADDLYAVGTYSTITSSDALAP